MASRMTKALKSEIKYCEQKMKVTDPLSAMIIGLHLKDLKKQLKTIADNNTNKLKKEYK